MIKVSSIKKAYNNRYQYPYDGEFGIRCFVDTKLKYLSQKIDV